MNKRNIIKILFKNEISTLILRLLILYIILFISKIIFYFYNQDIIGAIFLKDILLLIKGNFIFDNISIFYCNSLFIILSVLPLRIRERNVYQYFLFWIYTITNVIMIVFLNFGDIIYFRNTLKRFTSEEIHFTAYQNTFSIVKDVLLNNYWIIFIVIGLIIAMIYYYKKIPYFVLSIKKNLRYYLIHSFIFLITIFLVLGGIRGGFKFKLRPYNLCNAAQYTQSTQQAYLILSNPFCLFRTLGISALENPHYFTESALQKIFTPYHYPIDSLKYNLKGRNIIIFILESFSKEHSKFYCPDLYPDSDGYTPFLDSLMQESYTFTNAFANGMRSIEALPSILTSIPSYKKPFVMLPQSLGVLEGLPNILEKEGYITSFFCGTEKNSMFFNAYASMAGIQHIYSKEEYEKERPVNKNTIEPFWGVYDMPFYLYMADKIDEMPQPFCITNFNLTSHHPFSLPPDYADKMPKGHTLVQPCVAYTDLSLRTFFEKNKYKPWLKNTIFLFIADHVSSEIYAPQTRLPKGHTAIFYFIHTPDKVLHGKDTQITQQLDVMPTLLGLIGYKKNYFSFGRDIFNEPERMPLAITYINETYQCISDSITIYFDGEKTIAAFATNDDFQKENIVKAKLKQQQHSEIQLKAILQSYYNHITSKKYIVPKNPSKN